MLYPCRPLSNKILSKAQQNIKKMVEKQHEQPNLAIILIGNHKPSMVYVQKKIKICQQVGATAKLYHWPSDTSVEKIKRLIEKLNASASVHGILLQVPLPGHLKKYEHSLMQCIDAKKDVDGLNDINLGALFSGHNKFLPPTTSGIFQVIDALNIKLEGKSVVILGQGLLVGRPVAMNMIKQHATIHIFNALSDREDIKNALKESTVLISGTGIRNPIDPSWLNKQHTVIDVGISFTEEGKMQGDFDEKKLADHVKYITPVPGGIGLMTVACLVENLVLLTQMQSMRYD